MYYNKFSNRSISTYKRLVIIGYMQKVLSASDNVTSDEVKQLVINLKNCLNDYEEAYRDQSTKVMTAAIKKDCLTIDSCWKSVRNILKALASSPESDLTNTVQWAIEVVEGCGYIPQMSQNEKMASAAILTGHLDTVQSSMLDRMGISAFNTAMKDAYSDYQTVHTTRDSYREYLFERKTKARAALENAYFELLTAVEAHILLGSKDYDEFLVLVNRIDVPKIKADVDKAESSETESGTETVTTETTETTAGSDPEQAEEGTAEVPGSDSKNETIG